MKRPEYLIPAGLLASALVGSASALALWRAKGIRAILDWPTIAAIQHPVWLGLGEVLGALAVVAGVSALAGVGIRDASSALAALGVILLGFAAVGAVCLVALDMGLISAARGGILDAILFGQRWYVWGWFAWLFLTVGGLLGLVLLGIGIARSNRALRRPAAMLAGSAVLIAVFPRLGLACLVVVLLWIAVSVFRSGSSLPSRSTASPVAQ